MLKSTKREIYAITHTPHTTHSLSGFYSTLKTNKKIKQTWYFYRPAPWCFYIQAKNKSWHATLIYA